MSDTFSKRDIPPVARVLYVFIVLNVYIIPARYLAHNAVKVFIIKNEVVRFSRPAPRLHRHLQCEPFLSDIVNALLARL